MKLNFAHPTFTTERLRVWHIIGNPNPGVNVVRSMFIATVTDQDWPGIVVSLSIMRGVPAMGHVIDWIETASMQRRKGYARELVRGVEKFLGGTLYIGGVTPEGEAFEAAMDATAGGAA